MGKPYWQQPTLRMQLEQNQSNGALSCHASV
jgi:hypothetical protein